MLDDEKIILKQLRDIQKDKETGKTILGMLHSN